ncbi:hypothetical protein [Streptomyces rhizosphaericus]|uniref:hypothetical protein n=1 Tax=Streptomyces rhizosphaericus TaxID=114699 RepID=UPI000A3A28B3|nr:hypothetical protein [Streptomyces rhizosphaericus]
MARSAAQDLRREGQDPSEFGWVMLELAPLSAAGAAVNVHVWGLARAPSSRAATFSRSPTWINRRVPTSATWPGQRDMLVELIGFAIATRHPLSTSCARF